MRDVPYGAEPARTLDIYRPRGAADGLPVMLYLHGGGFVILSKDTHWMFGRALAARGWLVFVPNYRLAPAHPFPEPLEDCIAALKWVVEHAADYGGDISRLAYGGESAGANLALTLGVMGAWRRSEAFAREVWDLDAAPRAVVSACGILDVAEPERYLMQEKLRPVVRARIANVCNSYLPPSRRRDGELASPLRFLETAPRPDRDVPPVFAPCGTADPILDDSRRLAAALRGLDVDHWAPLYHRGPHAFHALVWSGLARQCWKDQDAFFARHGLR